MKKRKKPEKPLSGVVHLPRGLQTLGRIGSVGCLILALIFGWFSIAAVVSFALLAVAFYLLARVCRIWCVLYNAHGFETVNAFGVTRRYGYEDIQGMAGDWLYLKDRKLCLRKWAVGRMEFINTAHLRYRALHDNRPIPLVKRKKFDPFGGNVTNPWLYLLPHLGILVILLSLSLLALLMLIPETPENTTPMRLVFTGYKVEDRRILLTAPEEKLPLVIANSQEAVGDLLSHCDGETEFQAYVVRSHRPRNGRRLTSYNIQSLTGDDGTQYYTFQQSNAVARADCRKGLTFIGCGALLWLLFLSMVVYRPSSTKIQSENRISFLQEKHHNLERMLQRWKE